MKQPKLLEKIRSRVPILLNGYIKHDKILKNIDSYIVAPELGDRAGIMGALVLAEEAYKNV
jgi:fructokinase